MNNAHRSESELTCRQCGQLEAHAFGDEILCAACLHERGSCGAVPEPPETSIPREPAGAVAPNSPRDAMREAGG